MLKFGRYFWLLVLIAAPLRAEVAVRFNQTVNYDWVNSTYFSYDQTRLDTQVTLKLAFGSRYRNNAELLSFMAGINDPANQALLKSHYRLTNHAYLTLAHLAVGIMYAESKLGQHIKYRFKERFPWVVAVAKPLWDGPKLDYHTYLDAIEGTGAGARVEYEALKADVDAAALAGEVLDLSDNSRGPTQIKFLPDDFHELFPSIDKNNLNVPQYAAVATMAYLANAIPTLTRIAQKNHCDIPRDTFLYHLLYVYIGRGSAISDCTATLDQNIYWARMLEVQKDLSSEVKNPAPTRRSHLDLVKKLLDIQAELVARQEMVAILKRAIAATEKSRDEKLVFKQEDVNFMLDLAVASTIWKGSHYLLKIRMPNKHAWATKNTCTKLLIGRKRYFALLHAFNVLLIAKIIDDPKFGSDEYLEVDADKHLLDELRAALLLESTTIKRLELDMELTRAEFQL